MGLANWAKIGIVAGMVVTVGIGGLSSIELSEYLEKKLTTQNNGKSSKENES